MHLVVCMKQIIDPEVAPANFRIDREHRVPVRGNASLVASTFDECALELALTVKDQVGDNAARVTVLTVGPSSADDMLRKALAVRADHALRVAAEDLDYLDAPVVAHALAAVIDRLAPVDVVLCGRQAGDWDGGLVGPMLAEQLGWPLVCDAIGLESVANGWDIVQTGPQEQTRWHASGPVVVAATNAPGTVLRLAKVRDIMQASRRPLTVYQPTEIGIAADAFTAAHATSMVTDLFIPQTHSTCHVAQGDSLDDQIADLVSQLQKAQVL